MHKTQCESLAGKNPEHQWVRAIAPGNGVSTVLLVAESSRKEARNGPFWMLDLKDATGSIAARIWSPLSLRFEDIPAGALVAVEGRAERYREQTQLSVTDLRVLSEAEAARVDTSMFMPASARSPLLMLEELNALSDATLTHQPWRAFVRRVLTDEDIRSRLIKAPAARGIHHARSGGLLEHTLGVVRLCLHFAELYPQLDRQTLFAGALCHDLGKLWELSSGLNADYTDEGRLAGHIFLGLERLRPHMEAVGLGRDQVLHLQHLVLSHHGQYEYGSPRLPQTAEAIALHYADNMDAKMDQCRSLFADMAPEEAAWSSYQRSLERSIYRAPRTPEDVGESVGEGAEYGTCVADIAGVPEVMDADFEPDMPPPDDISEDDIPPDDIPEAEFAEKAFTEAAFTEGDFFTELSEIMPGNMPEDMPEDIPADFSAQDEYARTDECVFEHLVDDAEVNAVLASMEDGLMEDRLREENPAEENLVKENLPEACAAEPETVNTEPAPEPAPEPAEPVSTENVRQEKTRQEKTRLEVRQCSLL